MKLKREDAVLVMIDFQEKLMPAMKGKEELEAAAIKLAKGCNIMGLPTLVTQQYTKGLGNTIPNIAQAMGDFTPIEKTAFSAWGEPVFVEELKKTQKKTVILAGIECHVCVMQTALDLLEEGYQVFLVNDCVASRNNTDKKYAQRRVAEAGGIGTTYETVLFELLKGATAPEFKEISKLVK